MKNCMDCIYAKVSPYREATRFEPAEFPEFDYCNNTEVDDEVPERHPFELLCQAGKNRQYPLQVTRGVLSFWLVPGCLVL